MRKSRSSLKFALLLGFVALTSCHKTFVNDESPTKSRNQTIGPQMPPGEIALETVKKRREQLSINCSYETSSNLKLRIILDGKKNRVLSASLYDTNKNETAEGNSLKAKKQSEKNGLLTVELSDNLTLTVPVSLYLDPEDVEVRVNDEDIFRCEAF